MLFVAQNNKISRTEMLKKMLWLLAVMLFPAFIVSSSLKDFQLQLSDIQLRERENEAAVAISRLNREMHLKSVLDEAVRSFATRVETGLNADIESADFIRKFDRMFFHRFPDSGRLLWFNNSHKLISSVSAKKLLNRTVWEKFVLTSSNPDQAKILDKKIAGRFSRGIANRKSQTELA